MAASSRQKHTGPARAALRRHTERHLSGRAGWLRAAVLGADDAIVSTASLMLGVAASTAEGHAVLTAGVAGLFAGALSMAVGEFVSVGSQRDAEQADVEREKKELSAAPEAELRELAGIYRRRGLSDALALQVATALSAHDRLGAHLHDELGLEPGTLANPWQVAWISAASFATFALVPIAGLWFAPASLRLPSIALTSLAALASLGALGGHLGGAPKARAALRVTIGGALAMGVTAGIGQLLGQALV